MSWSKKLGLKWKFFVGSLFYFKYLPHAILYSRKRDRIERQYPLVPTSDAFENPGKLYKAEPTPTGAQFYFENAELEITFLTADFVLINWKPGVDPLPYAIIRDEWEPVQTHLEESDTGWKLSSSDVNIFVGIDGSLKYCNFNGQILREELPPQKTETGWTHRGKLQPEACIYGLGERSFSLNLRKAREITEKGEPTNKAKTFRMWNYDAAGKYSPGSDPMYLCIPLYIGLHQQGSYLIFYENTFEADFKFTEVASATFEGGSLRYYLTFGEPTQLLERYTELTGRSPLPPKWALGYHQSHWGYRNEEAIRDTYKSFEAHDLPLSAIHLDIDVQVGFRAFTIDAERFPNLGEFIRELSEHGVRFITILNPGIKFSRQSNLFLEGQILDGFCKYPDGELVVAPVWPGWTVFPDYTNPKVRRWWSRQYQYMLDVGVAGFWHDMNEPAAFIAWGDRSLPKPTRHYLEGRGGDHREAHNIYGLLQTQASFDSLCHYCDKRPFIVSRAGWAGLQRYGWTWTGDIECTWEALRCTISTVVGLGLSGISYSGSDIGGFQGNPSAELYLRWFQMSSFMTFYRTHSSNNVEDRNPWTYGEPTLSIARQFLKLRYRLLPYFYTLAWEAQQKGYPPLRPVFWADPQDMGLWDIDDGFLVGDALLVCPVTAEGMRSRFVTLPQGYWYNFWDDTLIEGKTQVEFPTPLEQIPILVKAGSILPMEEKTYLTLHLYPPQNGTQTTTLYFDAGDGYGVYRVDRIHFSNQEHRLELRWEFEGNFTFPYEKVTLQLHGLQLQSATVDDQQVPVDNNCFTLVKTSYSSELYQPFETALLLGL